MANILAFGDSNTWGLVPGNKGRYPWGVRWTSIVQERFRESNLIEDGVCGRTTVFEDRVRPNLKGYDLLASSIRNNYPLDAAVIMLGTNDCKSFYGADPKTIGKGLEKCLEELEKYIEPENILVISPIRLGEDVGNPEKDPEFDKVSVETSRHLKEEYRRIAERRGNRFLAASDYASPSTVDDEHLDENGHRFLAGAIIKKIEEMRIA